MTNPKKDRRDRLIRLVVASTWIGGLSLALRLGIASEDPAEVMSLLIAVYLAMWGLFLVLKPAGTTAIAARFLLCTFAVVAAIALVEAPALLGRIDYRDVFRTPTSAWRRPHHRPDPDLIYVREPHSRDRGQFVGSELLRVTGASPWAIYSFDVRRDKDGFRNPTDLTSADVVVVGDSFVEGLHVRDSELMTSRLASMTGLSVANLGRSGDGPQQERIILERFGLPLKPKVCVWLYYEGNDLEDVAEYESNRRVVGAIKARGESRAVYERSFVRNALMYARRSWIAPEKPSPASQFSGTFASRDRGPLPLLFASEDYHRGSLSDPSRLENAARAIAEAGEICERRGMRFVVAFVPTKWRVYGDLCRFANGSPCPSWELDDQPRRVRSAVAAISREVAFVDLTPGFRSEASRGELLYLPDDTHWTAAGHSSAASAIADALSSP